MPAYLWDAMWAPVWKGSMKHCGRGVYLRPMSSDIKGIENLSVGDYTSIPKNSTIYCTEAPCTIGSKVIFGPRPIIITGNHRFDIVGKFIIDITTEDKLVMGDGCSVLVDSNSSTSNPYDQPVVIEDDVWVGSNVTILKGVTIGRGSVIGSGAVVTRSCPPYSIIIGVPAHLQKHRFTVDQALEHERLLYPEEKRFSRSQIEAFCKEE